MTKPETPHSQVDLIANLERCPRFPRCNRNQCPLDYELSLRYLGNICPWMRDVSHGTVKGKPIKRGGKLMPDDLLKYVPEDNVERLNEPSRNRWHELRGRSDPKS